MEKPDAVVTAEPCTSTVSIKTLEDSTQTEMSVVQFSDARTMTDENTGEPSSFWIKQIQEDKKLFNITLGSLQWNYY